jgi:multidrug efflux system membrane fusion protein
VGLVTQKVVPIEVSAIGKGEAYMTISVKSRIAGQVIEIDFRGGQDVKKGDLLYKMDCRALEAQFAQAEATLARDIAAADLAEKELERYASLVEKGYVAREQYDQFRTGAETARATVQADKAAAQNLRVQLSYCAIYAPIDGRTGDYKVDRGNVVKDNDTVLVVINQVTPINVVFSVPEKYLSDIKKYKAKGDLAVKALIPGAEQGPEQGMLTFIDNTVDNATGTIALKATFENKQKRLWPGQFVNVVLKLTETDAVVVASQAVQTGQQGQFVFVVKPDDTVELRPVVIGTSSQGATVMQQGLAAGERVVLDGHLRLAPGSKITAKDAS